MLETTYLTVDKLKDFTPISANVDVSQLENFIPVAEEMHISVILGTALDTALKTELEATGTLSGDNETLLRYILNASAWFSFYEASNFLRSKFHNKGTTQMYSENSVVVPFEDWKAMRQDIYDKAQFYRNALIDFLNDNKSTYPLYRSDDDCDGFATKDNSSGIYL